MILMILQKKKKRMCKKYNPKNLLIRGQRFIEKKGKLHPEKAIAERVKLRGQKFDDTDLTETSSLEGDNDFDEFVDIPDMPPLEVDKE